MSLESNADRNLPIAANCCVDVKLRDEFIPQFLNADYSDNAVKRSRLLADYEALVRQTASDKKEEDTDRKENLVKLHSQVAAVQTAMKVQNKEYTDAQRWINEREKIRDAAKAERMDVTELRSSELSLWDRLTKVAATNPKQYGYDGDLAKTFARAQGMEMEIPIGIGEMRNALFKRDAGFAPFAIREQGYVPTAGFLRPLEALDLFTITGTTQHSIVYMQESPPTQGSGYVAEGAAYSQSTLGLVKKTVPVEKVGTMLPVTEEQLQDEHQALAYINNRLPLLLRLAINNELIKGDGAAGHWRGLLNAEDVQTQEGLEDSANKNKIITTGSSLLKECKQIQTLAWTTSWLPPTHYIMGHLMWDNIALAETTAGGFYMGNPQMMFMPMLWGLPVVQSASMPTSAKANDKYIGCGNFPVGVELIIKHDLVMEVGYRGTDFEKDLKTYKVKIRGCPVWRRPDCFAFLVKKTKDAK